MADWIWMSLPLSGAVSRISDFLKPHQKTQLESVMNHNMDVNVSLRESLTWLRCAASKFRNEKAPRYDKAPNEVLKHPEIENLLFTTFQIALISGLFPSSNRLLHVSSWFPNHIIKIKIFRWITVELFYSHVSTCINLTQAYQTAIWCAIWKIRRKATLPQ